MNNTDRKIRPWLIILAMLAAILPVMLTTGPAMAVSGSGNYANADIADEAYSHLGETGGQCRAFVNSVVSTVSNGSQNTSTSLAGGDYFQSFLNAGGVRVTDEADLIKGDIVQIGQYDSDPDLHTFIIYSRVDADTFNVVDSNHSYDEKVMTYSRTFSLSNETRAYRMGQEGQIGGGSTNEDGLQYIEAISGGVNVSSFNSSGSNWALQKRVGPWAPPVTTVAGDFAGSGSDNSLAYVTANSDGTVTMATLKSTSTSWSKIYQTGHWGRPIALVSGDFSNDGKDDSVAYFESTGNGTAQVSVFKSKGASGWTLLWRATGWGVPQAVVSGDFDNDGKDNDLAYVEGNADGTSRVSTIHSTGSSWSKIHQTGEWSPVYKVVAGDFAGTGKENSIVYVSRNADGTVDLDTMKSSGTSGWSSVWGEAGWQAPTQLATVNFNHDSEDDLFYVEPYGSGTKVSTFTSTGTNWGVGWQRTSWGPPVMVVGDFDN